MLYPLHTPQRVPVSVYRASDAGAPKLKMEAGSLKTLFKTVLTGGYGEGANRKDGLGWQMADETATGAVFANGSGFALKVDNAGSTSINTHIVCGDRWETYLGFTNKTENTFAYGNTNAMQNWLIVGNAHAFYLVLPENKEKGQILYFGKICGFYEDAHNIAYVNTSYGGNTNWDNGTFNQKNLMLTSQHQDGGSKPVATVACDGLSPFMNLAVPYPDAVFGDCLASAIVLVEKNASPRGTLPGLCWSYHKLLSGGVMQPVPMADGQDYIKLNLHDSADPKYGFVLNLNEWEM